MDACIVTIIIGRRIHDLCASIYTCIRIEKNKALAEVESSGCEGEYRGRDLILS